MNHFEFPDGDEILKNALSMANPALTPQEKDSRGEHSVILCKRQLGQWRSDAGKLLAHCVRTECAGKPFVEVIPTQRLLRSQADASGVVVSYR